MESIGFSAAHGRISPGNLVYYCQLNAVREFRAGFLSGDTRTSLSREDAFDGRVGIRAVPHGSLQRRDQVRLGVRPQQGQHPLGLVLAVTLNPEQTLQESTAWLTQFGESLLQLRLPSASILDGPVLFVHNPLPQWPWPAAARVGRSPRPADRKRSVPSR